MVIASSLIRTEMTSDHFHSSDRPGTKVSATPLGNFHGDPTQKRGTLQVLPESPY
jgi:hypothetical protein